MIHDLKVFQTQEELELFTDIIIILWFYHYRVLIYVILSGESSEWLELSIKSDCTIWNMEPSLSLSRFSIYHTYLLFLTEINIIQQDWFEF